MIKKLLLLIMFILPVFYVPIEIFYYYDIIDYKVISLTSTNLFAIIPFTSSMYYTITKQRNMILEMIPFYSIIFTSSTYHLCYNINISKYCIMYNNLYRYIDFINSYYCISSVILYMTKIEGTYDISKKRLLIYLFQLLLIILINIQVENENVNIFLNILISFIPFILSFLFNRNDVKNYFENYNYRYLVIGILLSTLGFLIYILIYNNIIKKEEYWMYHSYLWHIIMFLSSFFFFESYIYERPLLRLFKNEQIVNINI